MYTIKNESKYYQKFSYNNYFSYSIISHGLKRIEFDVQIFIKKFVSCNFVCIFSLLKGELYLMAEILKLLCNFATSVVRFRYYLSMINLYSC